MVLQILGGAHAPSKSAPGNIVESGVKHHIW
jgi:hypothetical protein